VLPQADRADGPDVGSAPAIQADMTSPIAFRSSVLRMFALLAMTGGLGLAMVPANISAQHRSTEPRTVRLTATDNMKFNLASFTAKPGELLRVVLTAVGVQPAPQMAHNFVLLNPTADKATFVMMAAMARDNGYMPPALQREVLASTDLAAAGQTVEVTFKAPAQSGSYPYLCSFPGHYNAGMTGTMIVKR
jgi:azurin